MVYEVKSMAKAIARKQLGIQARETLTARVHQKMFPTLQCLTAKSIWDNRCFFGHSEDTNLFALLPKVLRTSMLHQYSRRFFLQDFDENYTAAIEGTDNLSNRIMSLLLDQKVVGFKFPRYILYVQHESIYPEKPFWKTLLLKCPMLLELSCCHYHVHFTQHALFLDALMSMKHLQVLKLHKFSVNDSTLCLIAQNIPNLRVLKVELTQIASKNTMRTMSSLQQLEEFVFFVGEKECTPENCNHCGSCRLSRKFKRFVNRNNLKRCLKSLPHLKFAGQRLVFKDNNCYDRYWWSLLRACVITNELQCLKKPYTLGLQEVATESYLPEGINLPNLTSLHLYHAYSNFQCDDSRFVKVTELSCLFNAHWETCINIVQAIGLQLKILRIVAVLDTLTTFPFDVILRRCPNLEHLSLVECPLKYFTMVEPADLTNLKVLEILSGDAFLHSYVDSPTEVLLPLLQAPELRKLVISSTTILNIKLVEEITSMLQSQQILQKLEQAVLENTDSSITLRDTLLDSMILHCPRLINVSKSLVNCLPLLDSCWDGRDSCWDARNNL